MKVVENIIAKETVMKTIGVDTDNYLVYEGNGAWGHGIWPSPNLIPAAIVDIADSNPIATYTGDLLHLEFLFVDEGYDPASRIRKGRLYVKGDGQPQRWQVHAHPALFAGSKEGNGQMSQKSLVTFYSFHFYSKIQQRGIVEPGIILGSDKHYTIWTLADVETSISAEAILFIKSRKTLGVLPKINISSLTEDQIKDINRKLELVSHDLRRAGQDSVVDRCREAASAVINCFLKGGDLSHNYKDLGQLAEPLRKLGKHVAANCADTLAKLHSCTKFIEQKARNVRMASEQDAEFAVQSLGVILVELGIGYW